MDVLLQLAIFLIILGTGRLVIHHMTHHKYEQAIRDRDKAQQRLKELQK